jgi:integrase
VTSNAAALVSPPRVEQKGVAFLRPEQVRHVFDVIAEDDDRARWQLALLGLRQGEALGLSWHDIDLEAGTVTVQRCLQRQRGRGLVLVPPKSKTSQRLMRLPEPVVEALKARRHAQNLDRMRAATVWANDELLVFTSTLGRPVDPRRDYQQWCDLLKRCGLPKMRLHDARHTAATALLVAGVPLRVAMEWLGHSQISQTVRYTHVVPGLGSEASDGLARQYFAK